MTTTPLDAFALRRLVMGLPLNGELVNLSEAYRPVAERLAGTPPEERQAIWDAFLADRPDQNLLITAMAEVDPYGPTPEVSPAGSGSDPPSRGEPSEPPAGASGLPRLREGRLVFALDQNNFGFVEADLGADVQVHFTSPEGFEARPVLPKSLLRNQDGSPLTDDFSGGQGPDSWPELHPPDVPEVLPFPVGVLPGLAAQLVREGAAAIGCSEDFLGLSVLAVASGAIGRSVSLLLKPDYFTSAAIFAALVSLPSDGKSPALRAVAGAVRRIDGELAAEHAKAMKSWREEVEREPKDGKKQKPPPKPVRFLVDDVTMESMPGLLADNPRGLLRINDELTALVLGMNQFKGGRGDDRPMLLRSWSEEPIVKDRVTQGGNVPTRCAHPFLSIVGGLTPDMLGSLIDSKGRADGLIDRILFSCPDPRPVPPWSESGLSRETSDGWYGLVVRLWDRPLRDQGARKVPHIARFTPAGKERWQALYNAHCEEMNAAGFEQSLRGTWGKFREYAGRLALVLACLNQAAGDWAALREAPQVDDQEVDGAWKLIDYFKTHARRVRALIAGAAGFGGSPVCKAIVDWLRAGRRSSFSLHELKQARRSLPEANLVDALKFLTANNVIRPRRPETRGPQGGRPPSPVYDVNPALHDTQNPRNPRNPEPEVGDAGGSESFEVSSNE
jgi:hypothetical protein